jgi:hypothetical protein
MSNVLCGTIPKPSNDDSQGPAQHRLRRGDDMQTLEHRRLAGRHPGDALNMTFAGVTDTVC